jgi:lipoprotein-releasing system permease protein
MTLNFFTLSVALRHLRYGVGQSLLTIGVIAISVLLIVYLRTVIGGTQIRIVDNVTGSIPHIVLEPPERTPIGAWQLPALPGNTLYVGETVNLPRAQDKIDDWQQWLPALERDPEVTVVSPVVTGNVFMFRGARRESVRMTGVMAERHDRIVNIEENLLEGRFLQMTTGEVALGTTLATEFGIRMRDKLRLLGPDGRSLSVTVAGIYETGSGALDDGQVFLTLRDGQSLLELGSAASSLGLRIRDLYQAEVIAESMALRLPFKIRSWIADNPSVFRTLDAQDQTINMVLISTIIAAGFGIASILVMAVTGKYREIGILKAMGATPGEIQTIFVVEGFLLAVLGCMVGIPIGILLLEALSNVQVPGPGGRMTALFEIRIDPWLLAGASAVAVTVGVIAAFFPARRAGNVDPMQVIRGS